MNLYLSYFRNKFNNERGSMLLYLLGAFAAILVFFAAFYFLWAEIRTWFIDGH